MIKLCGYDLNGWYDLASRNWLIGSDGDEIEELVTTEGGSFGSIVEVNEGREARHIGGPQAILAPHGRGPGWGQIGKDSRRRTVKELLTSPYAAPDEIGRAFAGMATGARFGVASLNDLPVNDEILQERLIAGLRKAKVTSPLLVWRPVLAALHSITEGQINHPVKIAVINHTREGFTFQTLEVKTQNGDRAGILAPERKLSGRLIESDWGYEHLANQATRIVTEALSADWSVQVEIARSIGDLTLGLPTQPELIRINNGRWKIINPPKALDIAKLSAPSSIVKIAEGCEIVLFETLATGHIRQKLTEQLRALFGERLAVLRQEAVTLGAHAAATRMSRKEPVYFDFLPQISTIVQKGTGAENYDLISRDATLPAGEVYRSPTPAKLAIQAGQAKFDIFIFKQNSLKPRKATVDLGSKLGGITPVDVRVEQSPASGRARITVQADSIARQFLIDWDSAEELDMSWHELIEIRQRPEPTIPSRLVIPCTNNLWVESNFANGFIDIVNANADRNDVDWKSLADKADDRFERAYAVSSDGELPNEIDEETRANLSRLIRRAHVHVLSRMSDPLVANNDSLRFLTWLFKLCPLEIQSLLLDAWEQQEKGHRLFSHPSHWKLAYQGFGRSVSESKLELRAITKILRKPVNDWLWQRETAAMAFMLSRSDSAPRHLLRSDIEIIGQRVLIEFKANLNSTYTKFHYAPFLLVGMLRWRIIESFALIIGTDPLADKLSQAVKLTLKDLEVRNRYAARAKYKTILDQILEELSGQGSNPELLLDIYSGADEVE
jgi:hypothetical protein